jgi:hypothetical protein
VRHQQTPWKVTTAVFKDFWQVYMVESAKLIDGFKSEMDHQALQAIMAQLIEYDQLMRQLQCEELEHQKVIDAVESLVRLQMSMVMRNAVKLDKWVARNDTLLTKFYDWDETVRCWRLDLPKCAQCVGGRKCSNAHHVNCPPRGMNEEDLTLNLMLQGTYDDNGVLIPNYPDHYKSVARIDIPRRLSDPAHWGHSAWQFCKFMDSR